MPKFTPTHLLTYTAITFGFALCVYHTKSGPASMGSINPQRLSPQLLHEPTYSVPFKLSTNHNIHIDDTIDIDLLSYCVLTHDYESVTSLLNHRDIYGRHIVNINTTDDTYHISPLFIAMIQNDMHMLRLLLQRRDLDTNLAGVGGLPPISYAITQGLDKELMIRLMGHPSMDINTPNPTDHNYTPLMYAIMADDKDMIDYIVNFPNVDFTKESTVDNDGLNAVMLAAKNNYPYAIDAIALEQPSVMHVPSSSQRYPIYYAIAHHHIDCMQACINHGGVNQPCDRDNTSPLMLACHYHHEDMATLLLDNDNIDFNITNSHNQTVVDVAYAVGFDHIISHLGNNKPLACMLVDALETELKDDVYADHYNDAPITHNRLISNVIDDGVVHTNNDNIQTECTNASIHNVSDSAVCESSVIHNVSYDEPSHNDAIKTCTEGVSNMLQRDLTINESAADDAIKINPSVLEPSDNQIERLVPSHYTYDTHALIQIAKHHGYPVHYHGFKQHREPTSRLDDIISSDLGYALTIFTVSCVGNRFSKIKTFV